MIVGHGDDLWRYGRPIIANFSSNVFSRVDLSGLKAHLAEHLNDIGHYPEPEPYTLEAAIAARHGIPAESVCVTGGATEAIYLIALAWRASRSTIAGPTFSEYEDACRLHGHSIETVISTGAKRSGEISRQARDDNGDMVWLCNPNNPDGRVTPQEQLQAEVKSNPDRLFVLDQSYGFFTREPLMSAAEAVSSGNVLQLHSMTKRYAMPGIRLGYVVGAPQLIARIRKVRMPWSVNALAIEAGLWLSAHPDAAPIDLPALLHEAQRLRDALNRITGIEVLPTKTHFMLCKISPPSPAGAKREREISRQARDDNRFSAANLKTWLMERHGLLIRDASNFEGLGPEYFRIAAQSAEENDLLVKAIEEYLR